MTKELNVGVVGLGRAGEKHALAYHKLPFVHVAAVCDRDEQTLARVSNELGAKAYTDYHQLLADSNIDAVSLVMPDTLHLDAARVALDNDKHILLEKPIAANLADGAEILKKAEESKKVFMVGHLLRFMAGHSIAHQRIADGEIGELVHVSGRRNSMLQGAQKYSSHHTDTQIHLMVHDLDYLNWISRSRAVKVYAKARQLLLKEIGIRDTILAIVEYESGLIASLEACWILPDSSPQDLDDGMEIVGTNGVIYLESGCRGIDIVKPSEVRRPSTVAWPEINGYVGGAIFEEITSFVNCVVNGDKPLVGARQAYDALVVADAIDRSIKEGREITLE